VPRHLAGLRLGVRLPTSEEVRDGNGQRFDIDAQPDAGAAGPNIGLWYGYYQLPVFVGVSATHLFYGHGNQDFDPGDVSVGSLVLQYGFSRLAMQLGFDVRNSQKNRFSGVEDPDSGGFLGMGSAGLALRLGTDFVINAGVQVPAIRQLNGTQDAKNTYRVGVAYDF
jgi:hypothetical protein